MLPWSTSVIRQHSNDRIVLPGEILLKEVRRSYRSCWLIVRPCLGPGSNDGVAYDDLLRTGPTAAWCGMEVLSAVRLTAISRSNHPALNHSDVSIVYSSREGLCLFLSAPFLRSVQSQHSKERTTPCAIKNIANSQALC